MGCSVQLLYHGNSSHHFMIINVMPSTCKTVPFIQAVRSWPHIRSLQNICAFVSSPHLSEHSLFTPPLQVLTNTHLF